MILERNTKVSSGNPTLISVIIPTFNAKNRLILLLNSLNNQTCKNFETIIVDDGSTDGTREEILKLMDISSGFMRYFYLDNADIFGAGIARNYGARKAKGEILLFLDQDCVAQCHLIENHVRHHRAKNIILGYYAGYGNEERSYDFTELEQFVIENNDIPFIEEFRDRLFNEAGNNPPWKYFVSAHFSIKRKIFNEINFDESFTQWGCEDIDLGYRLHRNSNAIYFEKNCIVYDSSECSMYSKEKMISLASSLIQMHQKYKTEEMKLYCLERFYHFPLEYRNKMHMIFNEKCLELQELNSFITIDKYFKAVVILKADYKNAFNIVEDLIPIIKSVSFKISFISDINNKELSIFRECFHKLIRVLRNNKIIVNFNEIRKESFLIGKRLLGPKELSIDFHNKCNTKCQFCFLFSPLLKNKPSLPKFLDYESINIILNEAYDMGVQLIRISSEGEPFLSPNITSILSLIAQKGFELEILTNGTLIRKEHLSELGKISKLGINLNFSAAKRETYQTIYGGNENNYEFVINSLTALNMLKQKKLLLNKLVSISTVYIITVSNYNEISDHIVLVNKLGVNNVYFKLAFIYEGTESISVSAIDVRIIQKFLLKAMLVANNCGISTNLKSIYDTISRNRYKNYNRSNKKGSNMNLATDHCYNGWFFARINSSGKYYICCRETVELGNAPKRGFKNIFFSTEMKRLLDEGASGISLDKKMWSKCNYCYHLKTNKTASILLKENETSHSCH